MKHQWKVRRQFKPCPDGEQRWDRAYRYILGWAVTADQPGAATSPLTSPSYQEVNHADRSLCPSIHPASGSTADN
jgi:hypothetical protein